MAITQPPIFPKNEKGSGVIQIMLILGLTTIILAGLSGINSNSLLEEKDIEEKFNMIYVHNEIYNVLTIQEACVRTFKNSQLRSSPFGTQFAFDPIDAILNQDGRVEYKTFSSIPGGTLYKRGTIRINKMSIGDYRLDAATSAAFPGKNFDTAQLRIEYAKASPSVGPDTYTRDLRLIIKKWVAGDIDPATGQPVSGTLVGTLRSCNVFNTHLDRVRYNMVACDGSLLGGPCTLNCPINYSMLGTAPFFFKNHTSYVGLCGS